MPEPAFPLPRPLIAAVSDRRLLHPHHEDERVTRFGAWATAVARAGVDLIQIRERDLEGGPLAALVRRVLAATRGTAVRVIVNERADVALAAGAHGVHLPSSAVAAPRLRQLMPPGFVIGRSVHGADEARAAEQLGGCDYLVFGTVFASVSKPATHRAAGLAALQEVVRAVQLPVLAIGGISIRRAGEVARTGAAGIAAISMFSESWSPEFEGDDALAQVVEALRQPFMPDAGAMVR